MIQNYSQEKQDQLVIKLCLTNKMLPTVHISNYIHLKELNLSNNVLEKIDLKWPMLIEILFLNGNLLTSLSSVPSNIVVLGLSNNKLTHLCSLPTTLKILDVRNNLLSTTEEFKGLQLASLYCTGNPFNFHPNYQQVMQFNCPTALVNQSHFTPEQHLLDPLLKIELYNISNNWSVLVKKYPKCKQFTLIVDVYQFNFDLKSMAKSSVLTSTVPITNLIDAFQLYSTDIPSNSKIIVESQSVTLFKTKVSLENCTCNVRWIQ